MLKLNTVVIRLFYAGAAQGQMPVMLTMVSARATPAPAVLAVALLSLLYLTVSDIFALINYVGFATWVCWTHHIFEAHVLKRVPGWPSFAFFGKFYKKLIAARSVNRSRNPLHIPWKSFKPFTRFRLYYTRIARLKVLYIRIDFCFICQLPIDVDLSLEKGFWRTKPRKPDELDTISFSFIFLWQYSFRLLCQCHVQEVRKQGFLRKVRNKHGIWKSI